MQGSDHWVEGIEVMARCMHNNHALRLSLHAKVVTFPLPNSMVAEFYNSDEG